MTHDTVLYYNITTIQHQNVSVQRTDNVIANLHVEQINQYAQVVPVPNQTLMTSSEIPVAVDVVAVVDASVAIDVNFFIGYSNAKESGMFLIVWLHEVCNP